MGTAGDALLDEVHPFDTVINVWIDRIASLKRLARRA